MKRLKLFFISLVLLSGLASPFVSSAAGFYGEPALTPTFSQRERGTEDGISLKGQGTENGIFHEERRDVRVVEIKATPGVVEPIEVLTLNTTMYNESERADGLVVELTVTAPNGETVQNMRQRNVGVDPSDDMAVYWVWRIPQRLDDGTYSVQVTVYEPDGSTVIDREQEVEAFAVRKVDREIVQAN